MHEEMLFCLLNPFIEEYIEYDSNDQGRANRVGTRFSGQLLSLHSLCILVTWVSLLQNNSNSNCYDNIV